MNNNIREEIQFLERCLNYRERHYQEVIEAVNNLRIEKECELYEYIRTANDGDSIVEAARIMESIDILHEVADEIESQLSGYEDMVSDDIYKLEKMLNSIESEYDTDEVEDMTCYPLDLEDCSDIDTNNDDTAYTIPF